MINERNKQRTFNTAKQNVSQSNSFTFYLARLLIHSDKLKYFYCWYSYFRWVDDIADSNDTLLSERILFIDSQISLVESIYANANLNDTTQIGEYFLYELIEFDKSRGPRIKEYITQMLECIQFDISRIGKYSKSDELCFYFNKEVLSYLNTFQFFCSNQETFCAVNSSLEGNAGKSIHILRDFIKDYNEQIFNLSVEDIEKYEINPVNYHDLIKSYGLKNWVSYKIADAENKFKQGKIEVRNHPSLSYKILVLILCLKYNLYLQKIKRYKCSLQLDYKLSKTSVLLSLPKFLIELICIFVIHIKIKLINLRTI